MKVSKETIIRTVILVLALVNQILQSTGHSILPFESETVAELISLALTVGASAWAWWKNNSFTKAALIGDQAMRAEREKNKFTVE